MQKVIVWDLDGTLINSYPNIVKALSVILIKNNIKIGEKEILDYVKEKSTYEFLIYISEKYTKDFIKLKTSYSKILKEKNKEINLYSGAKEILNKIKEQGDKNILYTHKSDTCISILQSLQIYEYFDDIITSDNKIFVRKPNPEVINILKTYKKYAKMKFYYIGDRKLDVDLAKNSHITSIYFGNNDYQATYNVNKLEKINKILYQ